MISPFVGLALGFFITLTRAHQESDWLGLGQVFAVGGGLIGGAALSVVFAVISLRRREENSGWAAFVSLPSAGLIVWIMFTLFKSNPDEKLYLEWERQVGECRTELRRDPEVALREKWNLAKDGGQSDAFKDSFADPETPYTSELLERIYNEAPEMREYVFQHPACSAEFLAAHLQEACDRSKVSDRMLTYILLNPNTPSEVLEKVVSSTNLQFAPVQLAGEVLKQRQQGPPPPE